MKEKVTQLIAGKIIEQGQLKMALRSTIITNSLDNEVQNQILDRLQSLDEEIEILKKVLKELK